MSAQRGMVIVLEGLDRVGKSTQAIKLTQYLKSMGRTTELIRFPDRSTPTGSMISQYLSGESKMNDHVIHLLFTANRWEKFDQMLGMIKSGINVVIDRYSYSGVAYSSSKGLNFEWCKAPETGLIKPDCVIFLSNTLDEIKNRDNFGQEIYEKIEFQESVRKAYEKMIEPDWNIIDTSNKSIDDVHQEITKIVADKSTSLSEKINFLW